LSFEWGAVEQWVPILRFRKPTGWLSVKRVVKSERIPFITVGSVKIGNKIREEVTSKKLKFLVSEHDISANIKDGWVSSKVKAVADREVVVIT
jgi:hypothetical protein